MEWNRSTALPLATVACAFCSGDGLQKFKRSNRAAKPCGCVLRNVFRICYNKFRECVEMPASMSKAKLEATTQIKGYRIWGRKNEEYTADFYLIAKRTLDENDFRIFKFHFLLGADWKLCCRRLNMERGNFFHAVYRIQQLLGRAYRETEPFALFPLDEYFCVKLQKALPAKSNLVEMAPAPPRRTSYKVRVPIAA
jgi:hypothetical protein